MKQTHLLNTYQALVGRKVFSEKDTRQFFNLKQGHLGEKRLDKLLKDGLPPEAIVLHDLLLAYQHNVFQIDFLIILADELIILESKYYQGEFELLSGQLTHLKSHRTYQNPLYQLQRAHNYLQNILQKMSIHFPISSYIVFVHPEMTVYMKKNPHIILPTQIKQFISKINQKIGQGGNTRLARRLQSMAIKDNPYERLPNYDFEKLLKGPLCADCRRLMVKVNRKMVCCNCDVYESYEQIMIRLLAEYKLLFKSQIRLKELKAWLQLDINDKTYRNIMKKHYKHHSNTTGSYYVL